MENLTIQSICKRFGCARNLAIVSGVSTSLLSRILSGKRPLGIKTAVKISKAAKLKIHVADDGSVKFEDR
jgi:transcriptional regulator with XRE-family HTH domain